LLLHKLRKERPILNSSVLVFLFFFVFSDFKWKNDILTNFFWSIFNSSLSSPFIYLFWFYF